MDEKQDRKSAKWTTRFPKLPESEPLPKNLEKRVREALAAHKPMQVEAFVNRCEDAVSLYSFFSDLRDELPTGTQTKRAARTLLNRTTKVREILSHITDEGTFPARDLPGYLLAGLQARGWEEPWDDLIELEQKLQELEYACQEIPSRMQGEPKKISLSRKHANPTPQADVAGHLANEYRNAFGVRPTVHQSEAGDQGRENHASDFLIILKQLLFHIEGRERSLSSVRHIAREGISWLK